MHIRAVLVKLFDPHDGKGANWPLMLKSLYRAGFGMVDDWEDEAAKVRLMRRVHEGVTTRFVQNHTLREG